MKALEQSIRTSTSKFSESEKYEPTVPTNFKV